MAGIRPRVVVAVLATLSALTFASTASAATFTVVSAMDAGDASDDGICATSTGVCTLRAAIEEANRGPSADTINFHPSIQNATITLTSPLNVGVLGQPRPVTIDGCSGAAAPTQPCVGLRGDQDNPSLFSALFAVNSDDAQISGFAMTNADRAVFAGAFANNLKLRNNWFGVRLDGTTIERIRLPVTATGNDITIGGTSPAHRNVFAGNGSGTAIYAFASARTAVRGNYIGTLPDGTTSAPFSIGVHVVGNQFDNGGDDAVIGGSIPAGSWGGVCDDACNVINSTTAVHLGADTPNDSTASDRATVAGNHIGLDRNGTAFASTNVGVNAGGADDATIGGATVAERNLITASQTGVLAGEGLGAVNLAIRGNYVGTDAAGTAKRGTLSRGGIDVYSPATGPSAVVDNTVAIGGEFGVRVMGGPNAAVRNNRVGIAPGNVAKIGSGGESVGIAVLGEDADETVSATVSGNVVGNAGRAGVLVAGARGTRVVTNSIGTDGAGGNHGNGSFGVLLEDREGVPASQTVIGGNTPAEENEISNNPAAGIAIAGAGAGNTVGIVRGSNNGTDESRGRPGFIDLIGEVGSGNGPDGPNGGVEAPRVVHAGTDSILGTGTPGASVVVFEVGSETDRGTIVGTVATITPVGADGVWRGIYPVQPSDGDVVAAVQVLPGSEGGVSELSNALTSRPPVIEGGQPDTSISGPDITNDPTPAFDLSSTHAEGGYLCRLDGAGLYEPCAAPFIPASPLAEGEHVLEAVAIDRAGLRDDTPAEKRFVVDLTAPEAPQITAGPNGPTDDATPTFAFTGEPGATFQCAIDGAAPVPCADTYTAPQLAPGAHEFRVTQRDAAGNLSPAAARAFSVRGKQVDGAPDTRFVKKPKRKVKAKGKRAKVKIAFESTIPGSRFECSVDGAPFARCESPLKLRLRPGKHTVAVRAVSRGVADPTPATAKIKVKRRR